MKTNKVVPERTTLFVCIEFCLSLRNIDFGLSAVNQIVGKVIYHSPIEILVHIAKSVTLCRQIQHIEALVCANQSVCHARRVSWVNIVVNLTVNKHLMPLQTTCQLGVTADSVNECSVALVAHLLLYAVVCLAPPAVVDSVVVVTCARYRSLEEVGVLQNSSR